MNRWVIVSLAGLSALVFVCCQGGPISAEIAAGLAGALAVADQLLAGGVMTPEQHETLVAFLRQADETARAAQDPAQTAGIAGGVTATILAGLKAYAAFQRRGQRDASAQPATPTT